MAWWQEAFIGGAVAMAVGLLSSISDTLKGIHNTAQIARQEADNNHQQLLHNLYNLAKQRKPRDEDAF